MNRKLLVLGLLGFGAYTAAALGPVYTAQWQLERALERVIVENGHVVTDASIRGRAAETIRNLALAADPADVRIRRETRPGERFVQVELAYPAAWTFLGRERQSRRTVRVSHTWTLDEAAEARRVAAIRAEEARREAEIEAVRERNRKSAERQRREIREECEKASGEHFVATHVWTLYENGEQRIVDCASVYD